MPELRLDAALAGLAFGFSYLLFRLFGRISGLDQLARSHPRSLITRPSFPCLDICPVKGTFLFISVAYYSYKPTYSNCDAGVAPSTLEAIITIAHILSSYS
jgi:hypothetical protein